MVDKTWARRVPQATTSPRDLKNLIERSYLLKSIATAFFAKKIFASDIKVAIIVAEAPV
jgi:hypothetical protein